MGRPLVQYRCEFNHSRPPSLSAKTQARATKIQCSSKRRGLNDRLFTSCIRRFYIHHIQIICDKCSDQVDVWGLMGIVTSGLQDEYSSEECIRYHQTALCMLVQISDNIIPAVKIPSHRLIDMKYSWSTFIARGINKILSACPTLRAKSIFVFIIARPNNYKILSRNPSCGTY